MVIPFIKSSIFHYNWTVILCQVCRFYPFLYLYIILAPISHNVPAVYDVLTVRMGFAKQRPGRAKCGGEKPHRGAKRRLGFFVAQNAARHFAYTVLLYAVRPYAIIFNYDPNHFAKKLC
jgi:hypothetical protein